MSESQFESGGSRSRSPRDFSCTGRFWSTACLVIVCLALSAASLAHDPVEHGIQMTVFDPLPPAPAFSLERLEGGTATLADFRGEYVLLNFWATWCPPCLKEMPTMQALHDTYRDRGFSVVAVSSDSEGAALVKGFVDRLGVDFPILLDVDGSVSASYGARNLPMSLLLTPDGEVLAAALGERDWGSEAAMSYVGELVETLERNSLRQ